MSGKERKGTVLIVIFSGLSWRYRSL